ncbi:SDR family NAD(P)-dependent oxidoreductase [Streptomyces sp. NBC_01304]|uniref:SDR family NAD(P)-dependent oxidoreductase n=1 Tax=Streptomyces sp. NBC_01304 TaxID=2903818 RepID=UPI002E0F9A61|nr:SDR family NAD(P)-dependent oxidoreductase [Streptomyces sp. NBC_01304]
MSEPAAAYREQVAVVVGGYDRIGRLVCEPLAARGVTVAITGPSAQQAALYCRELTDLSITALPYVVDPDDAAMVHRLVADVTHDLGAPDILIGLLPADGPPYPVATAMGKAMAEADRPGRIVLLVPHAEAPRAAVWALRTSSGTLRANVLSAAATASAEQIAGAALMLLGRDADRLAGAHIEVHGAGLPD